LWNSCGGKASSSIVTFFGCLQYPEILTPLRETLFMERARSHMEPHQGKRVMLVSWGTVMVENPINGPKFRPIFYTQLQVTDDKLD
jgi:hypothetical protein